jgi:hypothetical protein
MRRVMMKKFLRKWLGIDEIIQEKNDIINELEDKLVAVSEPNQAEEKVKKTPKELATLKREPWVAVLETHINKDDIRNGFFELDWNAIFIEELMKAGYGFEGDPDEEIVDRWFRDLAGNMLLEFGQEPSRSVGGYININRLGDGRTEVE